MRGNGSEARASTNVLTPRGGSGSETDDGHGARCAAVVLTLNPIATGEVAASRAQHIVGRAMLAFVARDVPDRSRTSYVQGQRVASSLDSHCS